MQGSFKMFLKSILLLLNLSLVFGRTGEVCFPFGSSEAPTDLPQALQGRPGKIGPRGFPGLKGEVGPPGGCACDPNEIEQLREENERQNAILDRLARIPRVVLCGVGLKDGRVPNQDISASSQWNSNYLPHHARLDRQGTSTQYGGWLGANGCSTGGHWIQADLKTPTRVVAVVTQGINYPGSAVHRVTGYKISYGNATNAMQVIQNPQGEELIFSGNVADRESHVTNDFPSPITARYFRLIVETWVNCGVVRLEYLTC